MKPLLVMLLLICLNACTISNSKQADKSTQSTLVKDSLKRAEVPVPGIVYFSDNDGLSWENKSKGLPKGIFLSDIAVSDSLLGLSTKQKGIFLYNFTENRWESTSQKPPTEANTDALLFFNNKLVAGTQGEGVFISSDKGKSWKQTNAGLSDFTIRRFANIDNKLYAGTNGGLFVFNEQGNKWLLLLGDKSLQVNGIIEFDNKIYLGTNQGIWYSPIDRKEWKQLLAERSLHNIGYANKVLYALAYNELYASTDNGQTWYNDQKGMPVGKYSFQLVQKNRFIFVGQWDGVYTKDQFNNWTLINKGLPRNIAITEMKVYKNKLVIASSVWVE